MSASGGITTSSTTGRTGSEWIRSRSFITTNIPEWPLMVDLSPAWGARGTTLFRPTRHECPSAINACAISSSRLRLAADAFLTESLPDLGQAQEGCADDLRLRRSDLRRRWNRGGFLPSNGTLASRSARHGRTPR